MTSNEFEAPQPPQQSAFDMREHDGHALLIMPTEHVAYAATVHGVRDAIRAGLVVDLDTGQAATDVLIFQSRLIATLKQSIGRKVLARLGRGPAQPGKSAPWTLTDASTDPAVVATAQTWLADNGHTLHAVEPATPSPFTGRAPF